MGLFLSEPFDPEQGVCYETIGLLFTYSGMRPSCRGLTEKENQIL